MEAKNLYICEIRKIEDNEFSNKDFYFIAGRKNGNNKEIYYEDVFDGKRYSLPADVGNLADLEGEYVVFVAAPVTQSKETVTDTELKKILNLFNTEITTPSNVVKLFANSSENKNMS